MGRKRKVDPGRPRGKSGPKPRTEPDELDALIMRIQLEYPGIHMRPLARLVTAALPEYTKNGKAVSHTTVIRRIRKRKDRKWVETFERGIMGLSAKLIESYERGLEKDDPHARRDLLNVLHPKSGKDGGKGNGIGATVDDVAGAIDRLTTGEIRRAAELLRRGIGEPSSE